MTANASVRTRMSFDLDHLFIWVSVGAPEADRLAAFGLTEGTPNIHPGQGTACRRFFFHNAYLELLWVHDPTEAQLELTRPTHLWERWRGRTDQSCPFGVGFRPATGQAGESRFSGWEYRPAYLPQSLSITMAGNAGVLTEPMLFHLAFAQRPDSRPIAERQPLDHAVSLREITRVEVVTPHTDSHSPELKAVLAASLMRLRAGAKYQVELGFDGEAQGQTADFRPWLPLIVCW